MKFLSDEIFVPVYIDDPYAENEYITYRVYLRSLDSVTKTLVYQGRMFYSTAGYHTPRIYLNDILETYIKPEMGIREVREDNLNLIPGKIVEYSDPAKMLFELSVVVDTGTGYLNIDYPDTIYAGYLDLDLHPNLQINKREMEVGYPYPTIHNPQSIREGIYPRVPNVFVEDWPREYWIQLQWIINDTYFKQCATNADGRRLVYIIGVDGKGVLDRSTQLETSLLNKYFITADGRGDVGFIGYNTREVFVSQENTWPNNSRSVKLFDVDDCPAQYYVVWLDRMGCFQSQPFNMRNTMSESINTQQVTSFNGIKYPYVKSTDYEWNLNTDWIDSKTQRTFESLLQSPFIYLYDTQRDKGNWCICKSSKWEEKTTRNNKKLYNFNVLLQADRTQRIIY